MSMSQEECTNIRKQYERKVGTGKGEGGGVFGWKQNRISPRPNPIILKSNEDYYSATHKS